MSSSDRKRRFFANHPGERNRIRQRNYAQTQDAPRSRRLWTTRELERIITDERPSDRELSAELGRSVQAIQVKRWGIR